MPQVTILPPARRSCEENVARRALVSPLHLRRYPASPASELRQLLRDECPHLEPVYARLGQKALDSKDATRIARELASIQNEVSRRQAQSHQLAQTYPLLYPKAA